MQYYVGNNKRRSDCVMLCGIYAGSKIRRADNFGCLLSDTGSALGSHYLKRTLYGIPKKYLLSPQNTQVLVPTYLLLVRRVISFMARGFHGVIASARVSEFHTRKLRRQTADIDTADRLTDRDQIRHYVVDIYYKSTT